MPAIVNPSMTTAQINTVLATSTSVMFESGTYNVTGALLMALDDTHVWGDGLVTLVASADHPILYLGGVMLGANHYFRRCSVRNLSLTRTNTTSSPGTAQTASDGIVMWGEDLLLEDLRIDNCWNGVLVRDEATRSRRVRMHRVRTFHSAPAATTSQWGIQVNECDGATIEDCHAEASWLDGLKLRKHTSDVRLIGGTYNQNVQNGVDIYAGGGGALLDGVVCDDNLNGSGFVVKTSTLNPSFGDLRSVEIVNCRARRNRSSGIGIAHDSTALGSPALMHVRLAGGDYSDNRCLVGSTVSTAGVFVDARCVELDGVLAIRNGGPGIWIRSDARDVRVRGGRLIANGGTAAVAINLICDGKRVHIDHPVLMGKDGTAVADDAAYDALPPVTAYGILCQTSCDDVTIALRAADARGHSALLVECSGPSTAKVVLHAEGAGDPNGVWPGVTGSTYSRNDGGVNTSRYLKQAGPAINKVDWYAVTP